jgi:PKD repeat protein
MRYVGASQGTSVLTFELKRSWENTPPIDNYTITVVSSGKYTGTYTPPVKVIPKHVTSTPVGVPASWDWRSQCTPIENQGSCGDCWAYASVGTLECNISIIDNVTKDLSEEYVTDCYTGNGSNGCNGGNVASDIYLSPKGAVYESDDPTSCNSTGQTGSCGGPYPYHETIDSHASVGGSMPSDAAMKQAIYDYGPIWIAVDASGFNSYNGGILSGQGSSIDHAVMLVGWDDAQGLRNSWAASWGISGYMYIAFGSYSVGTDADYDVYKGGIPHSVPPVAGFSASTTSSCTGTIQFTDASTNTPTAWAWTFGDGGTSTVQSPSHTYTASGTYTVSLTATNSFGNNTATKTGYITISLAASPVTSDGWALPGNSVTLQATGSGTLNWYNAATGGTLVNTGTSYTIPSLTTNSTYYVENDIVQPVQSVGMAAPTTDGAYYTATSAWGLNFDATSDVTINSVDVYGGGSGSTNIWVKNSGGSTLNTLAASVVSGKQTVTLNFAVPAGTGYELGADAACNLWRDATGASFPYTGGGISITGNPVPDAVHYYYFYNWQVSGGANCVSARVPVHASIITGINEISGGDFKAYPNPITSGSFDITLDNNNYQNVTVTIMNTLGETVLEKKITDNNPIHIDASNLQQGVYFVELRTDTKTYLRKVTIE